MGDYLQDRLDQAFPASSDAQLVRAVQQGILMADAVLENEIFLRGPIGKDVRGYMRRAGILSRVHAACEGGDLPFNSTISRMPRGPFHWVEIESGGFKAHICRSESAGAFPDDTPTRQDERLTNQRGLFENYIPLKDAAEAAESLCAWLTFGIPDAGELGHLCWAMPSADGETWLAHTNVLYRLAVAQVSVEAEAPPERAKIKFRDEIAEAIEPSENAANENREE